MEPPKLQWKYSNNWLVDNKPLREITACTVDPYGQVIIVGGSDGRFALICKKTGLPLPYTDEKLFADFWVDDRSRIQVISCALMPYNASCKQYQLMCAMGTASGLLQVTVMCIQDNLELAQDSLSSVTRLSQMSVLYLGWPHSIGQKQHGTGVRGGTLCVSTQDKLAVSGGGDGRCFLMMIYSPTYLCEDSHEDVIEDLGAPVTAITAEQDMVALGLMNGNVRVYRSDIFGDPTLLAALDNVSSQPITSLAWGMCDALDTINHLFLATGAFDEQIRTYLVRMDGQSALLEQLTGPGGPIVHLQIRDRFMVASTSKLHIGLWRISDSARCTSIRSIDMSKRSDADNSVVSPKRQLSLTLYFDGVLRPMHRFERVIPTVFQEADDVQPDEQPDYQPLEEGGEDMHQYEDRCEDESNDSDWSVEDFKSIMVDTSNELDVQDHQVCLTVTQELTVELATQEERFRYCTFLPLTL